MLMYLNRQERGGKKTHEIVDFECFLYSEILKSARQLQLLTSVCIYFVIFCVINVPVNFLVKNVTFVTI